MRTKTEKLVCTYEQASALKDFGIIQCSTFYFDNTKIDKPTLFVKCDIGYISISNPSPSMTFFEDRECLVSAFAAAELTPIINHLTGKAFEITGKYKEKYKETGEMDLLFKSEFIADVVLSAIEQKLITIEQINSMLTEGNLTAA